MAGLFSYAAAGAISGLGEGLVQQAEAERERALDELRRQERAAEREQERAWQMQDRAQGRAWDLSDRAQGRDWDISDRDEGRAWDESRIDQRAADYQTALAGGVTPDAYAALASLEATTGQTFTINSAYRSPEHNADVNGADNSQHTHGNAFDIDTSNMSQEQRIDLIRQARAVGFGGIGVYNNSLHFDVGPTRFWGSDYTAASLPGWAREAVQAERGEIPAETREAFRIIADPETPAAVRETVLADVTGAAEQRAAAVQAEIEREDARRAEDRRQEVEDRDVRLSREDAEAQLQAALDAERRRQDVIDEELETLRTFARSTPVAELLEEATRNADARLGLTEPPPAPSNRAELVIGMTYAHPSTGERMIWNGQNFSVVGQ